MENSRVLWYINRFKAISISEIIWRLDQKVLEKREERLYGNDSLEVINKIIDITERVSL